MTTEKKKWLVRSWAADDVIELETLLNRFESEGYVVYKINLSKRTVIAFYKGEPKPRGLDAILDALGKMPPPTAAAPSVLGDDIEIVPAQSNKGAHTGELVGNLHDLMESRARGGMRIEERLGVVVNAIFSKATRHEVTLSLEDIRAYAALHAKSVLEQRGQPCDESCSVSTVLKMAESKLVALIDAKPVQ